MSKKNDVSNKTLAMLVLAGIAISVIGLFLSTESGGPTGYAIIMNITNGNGSVQLFVNATLVLNLTDSNVSFSDIEPGVIKDSQDMGAQGMSGAGNEFAYDGANISGDWFNMSNEGGVKINISGYAAASPFTTTTDAANVLPNRFFQFYANKSTTTPGPTLLVNTTRGQVPGTFAGRTYIVKSLDNLETNNSVLVGIKVESPSDEDAGKKQTQINFVAEQESPGSIA